MDARTSLRKRVGDTPLVRAPKLAEAVGIDDLWLKMEGANPTGTQKDRIARLDVGEAVANKAPGISVGSCGNFGVAIAHAAYVHGLPCRVYVPQDFRGERIDTMQAMKAEVVPVAGSYEDAVDASRDHAAQNGWFDANPGRSGTLRTLVGYSTIAREIVERLGNAPASVGVPIGNGSTLAGVHVGFRTMWAQGKADHAPAIIGGSSANNNPVAVAVARRQDTVTPLDPRGIDETEVNEPLVNWDALDGQAALIGVQDSRGSAYGFEDGELMRLHEALLADGIDAHPASLSAVAALRTAIDEGVVPEDGPHVAVLTSGRPKYVVQQIERPDDLDAFVARLRTWLGRFGDPESETRQAVEAAFEGGFVISATDADGHAGYCVLAPMELDEFFPKYHLSYIAVDESSRGRGLGTILLEEAIRLSEGRLSLHVETDNEGAIALYEKFGFRPKYYRMLYQGGNAPAVDPAEGSGWAEEEPQTA